MKHTTLLLLLFFTTLNSFGATLTFVGGNANWNVASSWDLGVIPTAADDAIIPSGNRAYIPVSYIASAKSIVLSGTLNNDGNLTVSNSTGSGIFITGGFLDNRSSITVSNSGLHSIEVFSSGRVRNRNGGVITTKGNGGTGLYIDYHTQVTNSGLINITGPNVNDGLYCDARLENGTTGKIWVADTGDEGFDFTGYFINNGYMGTASNGNFGFKIDNGTIYDCLNNGTIEVKAGIEHGLRHLNGTFINSPLGAIKIGGDGGYNDAGFCVGEYPASNAVFENYGDIYIHDIKENPGRSGTGKGIIVDSYADFINDADIEIEDLEGTGFSTVPYATVNNLNDGIISIQDVGGRGMTVRSVFENEGRIYITNTHEYGMILIDAFAHFENDDYLDIRNPGYTPGTSYGLYVHEGTFINQPCAEVKLPDSPVQLWVLGGLENNGWLSTQGSESLVGPSVNNGLIEDADNGFLNASVAMTNNAIIAREISGTVSVGVAVPNFFALGSLSGFTVTSVDTSPSSGISAGNYNPVQNSFTPAAAAQGLTAVYAKVKDTSAECVRTLKIPIPGGVQLQGDPQEKSLEAAALSEGLQLLPNPSTGTFVLQIAEPATGDWYLVDAFGRNLWQHSGIEENYLEVQFPVGAEDGLYWLIGQFEDGRQVQEKVILRR